MNEPATIREILDNARTIAVVGLTNREGRASFGVSRFMQSQGYRIVNVFRAPEYVPAIVKDVMRLKIPYLWLQEGVVHDESAGWAEAAGVKVVQDHCILKERMAAGWKSQLPS